MRAFWWDGLFTGLVETVTLHYLSLFALAYGASNHEIGLLAAAVGLGAASSFLPGAWLSARWRYRKPFIILTRGGIAHLVLLAFALFPLFVDTPLGIRLLIAAAAMRSFAGGLAEGPWTSLAADIAPPGQRGRYFGSRNLIVGIGGLAGTGIVTLMLAGVGPGGGWPAVWLIVIVAGFASTLAYSRIPERHLPADGAAPAQQPCLSREIMKDSNFLRYVGSVLLWNLSLYMAAPFFNVHLVKNLGASQLWVGLLLALSAAFGLLGQAVFGRIVDGRGARPVIAITGVLISILPIAWYFVTEPYHVIAINSVGGIVWAAYILAGFNFLLAISPPGQHRYYAAVYQTAVYLSIFAGPLLGGVFAEIYGIKILFVLSGVGRLAACALFAAFVHDRVFAADAAARPAAGEAVPVPR